MFLNSVITYLNGWERLNNHHTNELSEIIEAIQSTDLLEVGKRSGKHKKGILGTHLEEWEAILEDKGWEEPRGRYYGIGQAKDTVAIRILLSRFDSFSTWLYSKANVGIKERVCDLPILLVYKKEALRKGLPKSGYASIIDFDRILKEIQEVSPISLEYPFVILGVSDEERPLEIFNIPSLVEEFNDNVVMNRSIEFPPEHYQAGLGILSYFNNLLKEKYPDTKARVKIIQEELTVKMIVETQNGDKHIIERALEEYDSIIRGEIKPEDYFSSPIKALELKTELRFAQMRIENQTELLAHKEKEIDRLLKIISQGLSQPLPPVHVSPIITVETSLNQETHINNELNSIIDTLKNLQSVSSSPSDIELLNEAENELSQLNKDNLKHSEGMSKLKSFLENINNLETTVGKSFITTNEGIKLLKKLAKHYNTIAPFCALPSIPFIK